MSSVSVKRVISHPDEVGRCGTKMSKQSSTEAIRVEVGAATASTFSTPTPTPPMPMPSSSQSQSPPCDVGNGDGHSHSHGHGDGKVAVAAAGAEEQNGMTHVAPSSRNDLDHDDAEAGPGGMVSDGTGTSNDRENSNSDSDIDNNNNNNIQDGTNKNDTTMESLEKKPSTESKQGGENEQQDTEQEHKQEQEHEHEQEQEHGPLSGFPRQVSVDSSAQIQQPPKVIEVTRSSSVSSSVIRNKSESTVGSSAGKVHDNWGWFEDFHDHSNSIKGNSHPKGSRRGSGNRKEGLLHFHDLVNPLNEIIPKKKGSGDKTMMAVTAPTYVLEESQSSQQLWKNTAGTRPPQPVDERAFYEKVWAQNFSRSQVDYQIPAEVLTATSPISLSPFADGNFGDAGQSLSGPDDFMAGSTVEGGGAAGLASEIAAVSSIAGGSKTTAAGFYGSSSRSKNRKEALMGPHNHHHTLVNKKVKEDGTDDELTVLVRGDNVFGTTVSKSFPKDNCDEGIDTVSISIASYRVVESKKYGKYAQFLVIFCEGTFRDTVGVWKRYSDFEKLSNRVSNGQEGCTSVLAGIHPLSVTEDQPEEMLPNAITSWNLLKRRKRWYRCLDAGYLSLKAFLLERFLHDILFESSTPQILRDFVGISNPNHQG